MIRVLYRFKEEETMLQLKSLSIFLLCLLAACGSASTPVVPAPGAASTVPPTVTETSTSTPTSTRTPSPSPTPEPTWMTDIKTQDPDVRSIRIENGQPVIDLYDTEAAENIILNQETIRILPTTDGLNPNILTANDAEGNQYAFNPDHGWYKVPEVQMDYVDLNNYTEVDQSFVEDGRANIATTLKYAENPTISPDAIDPIYWIAYNQYREVLSLCLNACGYRDYNHQYREQYSRMLYNTDNKPFSWTGFYKVHLDNDETIYVVSRTLKNPTESNNNQLINEFYGFDKQVYEFMANNMLNSGRTELKMNFDGIDNGSSDIAVILPPPEPYPFNPNSANLLGYPNPVVGNLQQRNELLSLFNQDDNHIIINLLQIIKSHFPLTQSLPVDLSKYILFSTIINSY
jgi:hypothetical protein